MSDGDALTGAQKSPPPPRLLRLVDIYPSGRGGQSHVQHLLDEELLRWLNAEYSLESKPVLPIVIDGLSPVNKAVLSRLILHLESESHAGGGAPTRPNPAGWDIRDVGEDGENGTGAIYIWNRAYFLPRPEGIDCGGAGGEEVAVLLFVSTKKMAQRSFYSSDTFKGTYLLHILLSSCLVGLSQLNKYFYASVLCCR